MRVFTNIPFFRIIIPFVFGIFFSMTFAVSSAHSIVFILLLAIALVLKLLKLQNKHSKRAFLLTIDVLFFLLAINLVNNANTIKKINYYGNYCNTEVQNTIIATISDLPIEKENFIKCQLNINQVKSDSGYRKVEGCMIGYFKKSAADSNLKVGATLIIKTKLLSISEPKNPFEFDYKNYLYI